MYLSKNIYIIAIFICLIFCAENLSAQKVPLIKVKIGEAQNSVSFKITSGRGVIVDNSNGTVLFFIHPERVYNIKRIDGKSWDLSWKDGKEVISCSDCSLSTIGMEDYVVFNDNSYRGRLIFLPDPYGKIMVLNQLPLEEYLCGVVPEELYTEYIEAMKAQSIVARTYTLSHMDTHKKEGYDLCSTSHCQVYGGMAGEQPLSTEAVYETEGLVITFEGKIASQTLYHSTCGGHTENNENVFLTDPIPYLRGVPCYIPFMGGRKKLCFCRMSSYFQWKVSWKKEELHRIVSSYYSMEPGDIKEISIPERGISGRVIVIKICTAKGDYYIEGDNIRNLLQYKNESGTYVKLRSTLFDLYLKENTYIAVGGGWGHGIGLCQRGAQGMAFWGYRYEEIIKKYFSGVEIIGDYGKSIGNN